MRRTGACRIDIVHDDILRDDILREDILRDSRPACAPPIAVATPGVCCGCRKGGGERSG